MKRILALILTFVMLFGILAGCQSAPNGGETTLAETQGPTQSPEEQEVLKVLLIGNSHGGCALTFLPEVFQKEAPDQKVVIARLYYSGCQMYQHADFIKNSKPEYEYHKYVDGHWQMTGSATVKMALMDEQWDIVSLQQMNWNIGDESQYVAEDFMTVINHVYENLKVKPKLYFHAPWSNPDDPSYWVNDWFKTNGWEDNHKRLFPGADGQYDQRVMYNTQMKMVQKYLVDSTAFLGENYFDTIVTTGTPIQYALDVKGLTCQQLYRDYTHLGDFGALMSSYYWYGKLMGLSSIDAVHVDEIPRNLHIEQSQYPSIGDLSITQEMKDVLLECVNWALANPYEVPAKTN